MKKNIYKIWIFLLSRSVIYILSFVSYNAHLFNIKKLLNIFVKNEILKYIIKYKIEMTFFIVLILLLFSSIIFIKNGISSARKDQIEIAKIKINNVDRQLSYISTFVLPLLASFQKIEISWLIFYEIFIFVIVLKNIEDYYKMIYALIFKEYVITLSSGEEITLFSNVLENISVENLPQKFNINCINISNENLSEYIYVQNKL